MDERCRLGLVSQRLPWRVFANALAGGGCSDAVASFWALDWGGDGGGDDGTGWGGP